MQTLSREHRTWAVIRIPFYQDSIDYRAYAEKLPRGSVLDWSLSRLSASIPPDISSVCVCATPREQERLMAAFSGDGMTFLCRTSQSEAHQCRQLMDEYGVSRIIGLRLSHAVAPVSALLRMLVPLHESLGATLTEVAAPAFPMSAYAIDALAVDALVAADTPNTGKEILQAAAVFRGHTSDPSRAAIASRWFRLEMDKILSIAAERWPEQIDLESSAGVAVLREMIEHQLAPDDRRDHYVDAWKAATIAVRRTARDDEARAIREHRKRLTPVAHRRTRVLYISASSYFHGASQSLCHLVEGLDTQRYEPYALVSYSGVLTEELRRRGVTVICPNENIKVLQGTGVSLACRVIRDVAPDVAHGNHDIGWPLMAALLGAGVPIVQHVRVAGFKPLLAEIHHASAIVAVSDRIKKQLGTLDIDPDSVDVIRDGIDTRDFMPAPTRKADARRALGIPEDEFVVSTIGRMKRQKRHETVVAAIGHLRRATGRGHLLLTAGLDGDRAYYDEIFALVRREGLAPHVTHIEFTQDVPSVLHASDSLALMSENEALGRVVLEAMAVGRPVVIGDSCGAVEVVEPGINGFVVPYRSATALASVLADLAADPIRAQRIGDAAAATIRTSVSAAHCAAQTMDVYERVLGRAGSLREHAPLRAPANPPART